MKLAVGLLAGVLAVMLGVGGCASSGQSGGGPARGNFLILNDQLVAQIKDGVSTKEDIKGLFGAPWRTGGPKDFPGLAADREMWCYSAGTQTHGHGLCLEFKDGIVQSTKGRLYRSNNKQCNPNRDRVSLQVRTA